MVCIYQKKGWPNFTWQAEELVAMTARVRSAQGWLLGRMAGMGFDFSLNETVRNMTREIVDSNKIEGENLSIAEVRSSVARRFGLDDGGMISSSRHVDGVVDMMIDATQRYLEPLTKERLFGWHSLLFPGGYSGGVKLTVGNWRIDEDGPMQVVSNNISRPVVHFEAPAAKIVEDEMDKFLSWFNEPPAENEDPVLRAALAHLWFVTIHPFDDGNGRIARAIADMQLARADNMPKRFYSMSSQIHVERKEYYKVLEETTSGGLDVTEWMYWFLQCLERAIKNSIELQQQIIAKASSWEIYKQYPVNERQKKIINLVLDGGFEGKLTNSRYAAITKSSADTALRDLTKLEEWGMVEKEGIGRGTSYNLVTYTQENLEEMKKTVLLPRLHGRRSRRGNSL